MGMATTSRMRGLGPRSLEQLAALGINSAEELRSKDAIALYASIKARWPGASLNLLYALIGAQEDLDWREVARERRTDILLRLDDLGLAPR